MVGIGGVEVVGMEYGVISHEIHQWQIMTSLSSNSGDRAVFQANYFYA